LAVASRPRSLAALLRVLHMLRMLGVLLLALLAHRLQTPSS